MFIGIVAGLDFAPSWTMSGIMAPVGLLCVAMGWKTDPRRWLLWVGLVINGLLLLATALIWVSEWNG